VPVRSATWKGSAGVMTECPRVSGRGARYRRKEPRPRKAERTDADCPMEGDSVRRAGPLGYSEGSAGGVTLHCRYTTPLDNPENTRTNREN
jgi:hypothetical protein